MRIVFIGAVDFSLHCLRELLAVPQAEVVAVITLPRDVGQRRHADFADLSDTAAQRHIPVFHMTSLADPDGAGVIRSLAPDVIFVFGWSQLIPRTVLDIPRLGSIGSHPALLPRHRGRHPLIWALVEGLEESGLTFFYLTEGADEGEIVWQQSFPIALSDDAGTLYEKIKILASRGIREFVPALERGTLVPTPQIEREATYWRKRTEADGELEWSAPSLNIHNLIRALTRPYVGAHTYVGDERMVVWRSTLPSTPLPADARLIPAGTVINATGNTLEVRTGDGWIAITDYQLEGGGRVPARTALGRPRALVAGEYRRQSL